MINDGIGDVGTAIAQQTQSKGKIHIFKVAKIVLVKPVDLRQNIPSIEGSRRTGAENLRQFPPRLAASCPKILAPNGSADVINIPGSIEERGILSGLHETAEKLEFRMRHAGLDEITQPIGRCKSIRVQTGNPLAILGGGKTDVVSRRKARIITCPNERKFGKGAFRSLH